MIKYLLITVLWIFTLSCSASTTNLNWEGEYKYFVKLGSTVGGSKMFREYKLFINPKDNSRKCSIEVDGFQTYERIICDLKKSNNKLTIMFKKFSNGTMLSDHGIEIYKNNEKLISLTNKNNTLLTLWHSKDLSLAKDYKKTGVFFKKIK